MTDQEISVAAQRRRQAAADLAGHLVNWLNGGARALFAAVGDAQAKAHLGGLVSSLGAVIAGRDGWAERQARDAADREAATVAQTFGAQPSLGAVYISGDDEAPISQEAK